jgi:hypothetical protein
MFAVGTTGQAGDHLRRRRTRKNALFAGCDQGAVNWACIASLIQLNGVDPEAYLEDVLTKLVNLWPASRIDELMPWAWARAQNSTERIAA